MTFKFLSGSLQETGPKFDLGNHFTSAGRVTTTRVSFSGTTGVLRVVSKEPYASLMGVGFSDTLSAAKIEEV